MKSKTDRLRLTLFTLFQGWDGITWLALLAGLALRFALIIAYPSFAADATQYRAGATSLVDYGVFDVWYDGQESGPQPSMSRVPGYSFFIAAIWTITGSRSETVVLFTQALVEMLCLTLAVTGLRMFAPPERPFLRSALVLAALAPFTATYSRFLYSETIAIALNTVGLSLAIRLFRVPSRGLALLLGTVLATATLLRPEHLPLGVLLGIALALFGGGERSRRLSAAAIVGVASLALVTPWMARNMALSGRLDLAERYPMPPEALTTNEGFFDWCHTWIVRPVDVHATYFAWTGELDTSALRRDAFSPELDKEKLDDMIARAATEPEDVDSEFKEVALQRRERDPLRFWVFLPAERAVRIWLTSQTTWIPVVSGVAIRTPRFDLAYALKLFIATVNASLLALALLGAWTLRRDHTWLIPIGLWIAYRTMALSFVIFPDPRYLIPIYPAIYLLAAAGVRWIGVWPQRGRAQPAAA